ncbi:ion transporter [bacterium]|nr:ion transporter [bacterium]
MLTLDYKIIMVAMYLKEKLKSLIESHHIEKFIMVLIALNLITFILDTMQSVHNILGEIFHGFEVISIIIFTVEYLCRVITLDRFKDIFKPMMLIDLFAILPFYLTFCSINTIFLRIFRLSRLIRLLKIGRYSNALNNIIQAFKEKKEELIITLSIFLTAILIASILMYIAENPVQPEVFSSVPKCFYFSIITFTSVGYGDISPISDFGKAVASITAILGVGLHGLFIGIFSVALMNAFSKKDENKEEQ